MNRLTDSFHSTDYPKVLTKRFSLRLRGQLKPRDHDCKFEFGLISAGRAKVGVRESRVMCAILTSYVPHAALR